METDGVSRKYRRPVGDRPHRPRRPVSGSPVHPLAKAVSTLRSATALQSSPRLAFSGAIADKWGMDLPLRPRRNRRTAGIRALVRETTLTPGDLIQPLFVHDGDGDE